MQMRLWHAAGAHLGHLPSPEPSRCPWETLDQGAWLAGWAPCAFQPALATGFPTPEAPWWLSWPMSGVWRGGGGVAEQSSGEGSGGTHIIGNGELVGAGWGTGVQTWAHQGDSVRPVGGGHPGPCAPHPAQPQLLSKQRDGNPSGRMSASLPGHVVASPRHAAQPAAHKALQTPGGPKPSGLQGMARVTAGSPWCRGHRLGDPDDPEPLLLGFLPLAIP